MHNNPTLYFSGLDRAEYLAVLSREGGVGMMSAEHALLPGLLRAMSDSYGPVKSHLEKPD